MIPLMGYNHGNWGVGEWLAMSAMMLLFWAVVIGLVVWAVRSYHGGSPRHGAVGVPAAGPDEVLAGRYARGEIDEDEFQRRRELLHSTSRPRT